MLTKKGSSSYVEKKKDGFKLLPRKRSRFQIYSASKEKKEEERIYNVPVMEMSPIGGGKVAY